MNVASLSVLPIQWRKKKCEPTKPLDNTFVISQWLGVLSGPWHGTHTHHVVAIGGNISWCMNIFHWWWFSPYVSDTHRLIRTFKWVCARSRWSSVCCYRRFVPWFLIIIGVVVRRVICLVAKEIGVESGKQSILIRINFAYQSNVQFTKIANIR